jgi:hypothetical protein
MDELPNGGLKILKINNMKNVRTVINFRGNGRLRIYQKNMFGSKFYKSNTYTYFSNFLKIVKVNVTIYSKKKPNRVKKKKILLKIISKIKNELHVYNILHHEKPHNNIRLNLSRFLDTNKLYEFGFKNFIVNFHNISIWYLFLY